MAQNSKEPKKPTSRTRPGDKTTDSKNTDRSLSTRSAPGAAVRTGVTKNPTVYKNAVIEGELREEISGHIQYQATEPAETHLDDFMDALSSAMARYFPDRAALYDIYTRILWDSHLYGVIQKRILSVLNQDVVYVDKDEEEIEGMEAFLESEELAVIQRAIIESDLWGISGLEFIPGPVMRVKQLPRKHIKTKTQIISINQSDQNDGFDYTKLENVWIIGDDENLGILQQCAPLVLYKRGALADWANFVEIFGMPVRIVKYDPFDSTSEAKLRNMIAEDGNLLAVMIPNTAQFEIVDGKTANANGDLQAGFVKYLDDEMGIAVLGNTETTGNSGSGSQAKSKTHSDQQKEITKADIRNNEIKLNSPHFIKILQSYGYPVVEGGKFKIKSKLDINYASQKAVIDTALSKGGLPIGENYAYKQYDIPKPGPDEKIITLALGGSEDTSLKLSGHDLTPSEQAALSMLRSRATDTNTDLIQQVSELIDKKFKDFFA